MASDPAYQMELFLWKMKQSKPNKILLFWEQVSLQLGATMQLFVSLAKHRIKRAIDALNNLGSAAKHVPGTNCDAESAICRFKRMQDRLVNGLHSTTAGSTTIAMNNSIDWILSLETKNEELFKLGMKFIFEEQSVASLKAKYATRNEQLKKRAYEIEQAKINEQRAKQKRQQQKLETINKMFKITTMTELKEKLKQKKTETKKIECIKTQLRIRKANNSKEFKFIKFSENGKKKTHQQLLKMFQQCLHKENNHKSKTSNK